MDICFNFYGLTIEVRSDSATLVEEVRRHFAFFSVVPQRGQVQVELHVVAPPYQKLPPLAASVITPRNICFSNENVTYIDYFGEGLAVFDRRKNVCTVYGTDTDRLQEIAFFFILSTAGQYLDSRGIHRVHALGVSYRGRGILLLLPSGGGKSTMALELMRRPDFLLLGEDTPLIDRTGRILPFPLRLGVRPSMDLAIPPQYVRTVRRMGLEPKTLVDIEYFKDRVGTAVQTGLLLVGERNLGDVSEITALDRRRALKALLKYSVVGLGVYQGMEFLLERSVWEIVGKANVATSRLYNSLMLLARVPTYRFVLGRSIERNCETFVDFAHQQLG